MMSAVDRTGWRARVITRACHVCEYGELASFYERAKQVLKTQSANSIFLPIRRFSSA
jgi:hypothetical protein